MPVYYLVNTKVLGFIPGTQNLKFNIVDQASIPVSKEFTVNWGNINQVSPLYCDPSNPIPVHAMLIDMALSHPFCLMNGIDIVGRIKRPNYLGVDAPAGGWFKVDLQPASIQLNMSATDNLNILDDALALPDSLRVAPDGSVSIVLSEAGKSQLSLTGTYPSYTASDETVPPTSGSAMNKGGDREKVRALLQAMADLLA
jgi:hypothetical protein